MVLRVPRTLTLLHTSAPQPSNAGLERTLPVANADTNDSDGDADDRRPGSEEEQQARTNGIGVRIWPKADSRSDDNEDERTGANDE